MKFNWLLLVFFLVTWREFQRDAAEWPDGIMATTMMKILPLRSSAERFIKEHSFDTNKGDFKLYECTEITP